LTVQTETPDDTTLVATVTVDAGIDTVYAAFTQPAEFAEWFWPKGFETAYTLDVREGGEYRVRSDVMNMGVTGRYLEVSPPHRLAMTWRWDGEPDESHVLVELTATGAGTKVVVTHSANPTAEVRDSHAVGWRDCLTRLTG
jgi:uncharacterized protein YndB with AHSA1/START domain